MKSNRTENRKGQTTQSFVQTKAFVIDLSKVKMSDKQFTKFIQYPHILAEQKTLPPDAKDHSLIGEWHDFREFHIRGDLLVIYQVENQTVKPVRLGTHSQLAEQGGELAANIDLLLKLQEPEPAQFQRKLVYERL